MITFDPRGMTAPLELLAETIGGVSDAPAVVARMVRGGLSASVATGVSDLESGAEARPNQTFDAGSQAKMMTAVIVLQLAEEGRIDLDLAAANWLPPDVVSGIPNADVATVRQLLAMTSGIPNYTEAVDADDLPLFVKALLENPGEVFGPEDSLAIARGMAAIGAPGAGFAYSNTNYLLLGSLIESVTGRPLAEVLDERVFGPANMGSSSARPFEIDDPRLASYALDPASGERIDVTDAPWALRGEGGVVTTTSDLIAFIQALLIDKTLLSEDSLAAMTRFTTFDEFGGQAASFGLGLARYTVDGGPDLIGFTGGTLGADSSTYIDLTSGAIVSIAATSPDSATLQGAAGLAAAILGTDAWSAPGQKGALNIVSGSAADLRIASTPSGITMTIEGASLALDRNLADLKSFGTHFADGSVLAIGSGRGETINILRPHPTARTADNQILGRGGDDRLKAGAGDDRVSGGSGDDKLHGRAGGDQLLGGSGDDWLIGGLGRDVLTGGAGADTFVFLSDADTMAGSLGRDVIRDFSPGADRVDLRALGDLQWIGTRSFCGEAGELRYVDGMLSGDSNGDGGADFEIVLSGFPQLSVQDILL